MSRKRPGRVPPVSRTTALWRPRLASATTPACARRGSMREKGSVSANPISASLPSGPSFPRTPSASVKAASNSGTPSMRRSGDPQVTRFRINPAKRERFELGLSPYLLNRVLPAIPQKRCRRGVPVRWFPWASIGCNHIGKPLLECSRRCSPISCNQHVRAADCSPAATALAAIHQRMLACPCPRCFLKAGCA